MGKLLANDDRRVADWVASRVPVFEFGSSPYTALGWANYQGQIVAGVIYQNYVHTSIEVHIAAVGKRWATRHFLGEIVRYPFEQLGCVRMTAPIPASNEASRRFVEHYGFTQEGRIRRQLKNGEDLIIYGLLHEECKWVNIGRSHGLQHTTAGYRRSA